MNREFEILDQQPAEITVVEVRLTTAVAVGEVPAAGVPDEDALITYRAGSDAGTEAFLASPDVEEIVAFVEADAARLSRAIDAAMESMSEAGVSASVESSVAALLGDTGSAVTISMTTWNSGFVAPADLTGFTSFDGFWRDSRSADAGSQTGFQADSGVTYMCGCAGCAAMREAADGEILQPAMAGTDPAAAPTQASFSVIDPLINEYDYQWGSYTPGTAVTVTYSFLTSVPSYYASNADERDNFVAMNNAQKTVVRDVLQLYAQVANITFTEVSGVGSMTFATADLGAGIGGWAYYPRPGYNGPSDGNVYGDVWMPNRYSAYASPAKGTWEYSAFIHEIGHAIGLKHPGNYNAGGGGTGGPYLPSSQDTNQYTVMSYYSSPLNGKEPVSPQLYDVAAVQYLYGANTSTRSGDSVYLFSTSYEVKTIWDGGGSDTIDVSNQLAGTTVNLSAGSFSSIGGLNNIAIAYGVAIESAIGSNYADTLMTSDDGGSLSGGGGSDMLYGGGGADTLIGGTGNDTLTARGGNDRLVGGAGSDVLQGDAGIDTFVFATGDSSVSSRDRILDFTIGTDLIDLQGIDADTSTSGVWDAFRFLATATFDGLTSALRYTYNSVSGLTVVEGDTNGDGAADFAIDLVGNKSLTRNDFTAESIRNVSPLNLSGTAAAETLTGDILDDTLSGLGANDRLFGLEGADFLDGGAGADAMFGGTGNDTYVVDDAGDEVIEVGGFTAPTGWTIKGTADFDGDGQIDVVVTNGTSLNQFWLMKNGAVATVINPGYSTTWSITGIGDYNGDGKKDILFGAPGTSQQVVNYYNGVTYLGYAYVTGRTADAIQSLAATEGTDLVQSSISHTLAGQVENLTLTGSGHLNGTGNALANAIVGNDGDNILTGKGGVDTLTGGLGADTFVFAGGDTGSALGLRDTITDFGTGADLIDLSAIDADTTAIGQDTFRWLGSVAFDGAAGALRTSYDGARNVTLLEGDVNGDSVADFGIELTGNKTLTTASFASGTLLAPLTLTGDGGANTLTGGRLNDTLSGLGANDTLYGFAGDDLLDGGTGADTMIGGAGNDTYVVDNAGDIVTEVGSFVAPAGWTIKGTADFDRDGDLDVLATNGTSANQFWLMSNGAVGTVVNLGFNAAWSIVGIGDFNGDGNKDILFVATGGTQQNVNYYNGLTWLGYAYVSGKSVDQLQPMSGNEGTDLVQSSVSYTLTHEVENLTLTGAGNLSGTGNALANIIIGNDGDNILTGKVGADTLVGGLGADIFVFAGGDTGSVTGTRDRIADFTSGTDQIDLSAIDADTTAAGHDAFGWLGAAAFGGTAGTLRTYYDSGRDVTVLEADVNGDMVADFGIDLAGNRTLTTGDFTSGSLLLPLSLSGDGGANTLTGGRLGDTLSGLGGNDTLIGLAGDDILDGGTGADALTGGTGNDTYIVDDAGDVVTETGSFVVPAGWTIKGTADIDKDGQLDVLATNNSSMNQFWLMKNGAVATVVNLGYSTTWSIVGLGDFNADGSKDVLFGASGSSQQVVNYYNGVAYGGYAYVTGKTGDALLPLAGNEGTDLVQASVSYTLTAGVENLTLTGSANIAGTGNGFDNILIGNDGDNILAGKAGVDTLTGGLGADTFVFANGETGATTGKRDRIADFVSGTDKIDLTGFDADSIAVGHDAFGWLGTAAFGGTAGTLRYSYDGGRNVTVLEGDVNGDMVADFGIDLTGNITLVTGDFTSGSLLLPLNLTGDGSANSLTGGRLNDTLSGLGGNDTLSGLAGADVLDGGTGADTMIGGTGNDTYVVDDIGDVVTETGSFAVPAGWTIKGTADFNKDGQLDVMATNNTSLNQFWLMKNGAVASVIDLGFSTTWSVAGIGDFNNDGNKDILFTAAGSTTQNANYYNGTAYQGWGYVTGKTVDALQPVAGNEGTDLVQSSVSHTLAGGVENLTLTGTANINGTGNDFDNVITGNDGDNVLEGRGGNDTLTGGLGADTFVFNLPRSGQDTITDFLSGLDTLEFSAAGFGGGLTANGAATLVTADSAAAATNAGTAGYFIFDNNGPDAGTVLWDPTGGAGSDAFAVAKLQGVSALSFSDFHIV